MMTESFLGLQHETVERLVLIAEGSAVSGNKGHVGLLSFIFYQVNGLSKEVYFKGVSSVLYFDDLHADRDLYPYTYITNENSGLFECIGSSYANRIKNRTEIIGGLFKEHRHFVYFDDFFYWHIMARDIEVRNFTRHEKQEV